MSGNKIRDKTKCEIKRTFAAKFDRFIGKLYFQFQN